MFSIFAHVMKTVPDTNSKPGLPVVGTPIQYVILLWWESAAGTLKPLAYTRVKSSRFSYPILD